jgi:type II secretion system protein N
MTVAAAIQKKWVRVTGYVLFGWLALVYGLHLSLPYGRIEEKLQDFAGDGFEVKVGSAGPGWFPGDVVLEDVTFKTRPQRDGEKPVEFTISRLELDVGVFGLIGGKLDLEFEGIVGGGELTGAVVVTKGQAKIDIRSAGLPLEGIPGIRTVTGGVPMTGALRAHFDVVLPKRKWREATGEVDLECTECTIGDGVAKIRPMAPGQQSAFSDGGFTLPKLKLGKLGGKLVIAKGLGKFQDFEGKSPDGELYLEGDIRFEDPVVRSQVTAYMRFKSSDKLKQREPVMGDIENLMKPASLRSDGYFGLKVTGPLNALRFLGSKISPVPAKDKDRDAAAKRGGSARSDEPPAVNLNPPTPTASPIPSPTPMPAPSDVPVPPPSPPMDVPPATTAPTPTPTPPPTDTTAATPPGMGMQPPIQPLEAQPMQIAPRPLNPDDVQRAPDSARPPDSAQPVPQPQPQPQIE